MMEAGLMVMVVWVVDGGWLMILAALSVDGGWVLIQE